MRARDVLAVLGLLAAVSAAAWFVMDLGGDGEREAAATSSTQPTADAATTTKKKLRAAPKGRAKAAEVVTVPPTGDPHFDDARRLAADGRQLDALELVVGNRRSDDRAWKDAARVAEIVTWEEAAIDQFSAGIEVKTGTKADDPVVGEGLARWLRRLDAAVLDPAQRRRLDLLRRKLVEEGRLTLASILEAASLEARRALAAHMQRFGGGADVPEASAPKADPGVVDALLAAVAARNKEPRAGPKGVARELPPLPVDDAALREQRRLEQLEKLRQRNAEGLLEPIAASLAWLALHQGDDGECSDGTVAARCLALGHVTPCNLAGGVNGSQYRLSGTGLTVLAMLDFRDQDLVSLFEPSLASGVDWLRRQMRADGSFPQHGYEAAIALMALGQAARASKSKELVAVVERGLKYYAAKASEDGGFRYSPSSPTGDLSVTGWYVQALEAARDAGAKIPDGFAANLERFTRSMWISGAKFKYDASRKSEQVSLAGVGMLSLAILNRESVEAEIPGWTEALVAATKRQRADLYAVYYEVRTELAFQGQLTVERRSLLADLPRVMQRKDLPVAGMFANAPVDPTAPVPAKGKPRWSDLSMLDRGGRVVATAFATLTLEHALYRR